MTDTDLYEFKQVCKNMHMIENAPNYPLLYNVVQVQLHSNRVTLQLCIPDSMRLHIMHTLHDSNTSAHPGWARTYAKALDAYWWPTMANDIKQYVLSCDTCQRRKKPTHIRAIPMQSPQTELKTMNNGEYVAMDIMGPFLPSRKHDNGKPYSYILSLMDQRSGMLILQPLRRQTTIEIVDRFIDGYCVYFGFPTHILSDRGQPFISRLMKEVCSALTIDKRCTSGYHPQTNGRVERSNKTVKDMLASCIQNKHNSWVKYISAVQYAYNTAAAAATNLTPFEVMFGRKESLGNPNLLARADNEPMYTHEYVNAIRTNIQETHALIDTHIDKIATDREAHNNVLPNVNTPHYKTGDLVYVFKPPKTYGKKTAALLSPYDGPYTVLSSKGPVTYKLQHTITKQKQ